MLFHIHKDEQRTFAKKIKVFRVFSCGECARKNHMNHDTEQNNNEIKVVCMKFSNLSSCRKTRVMRHAVEL